MKEAFTEKLNKNQISNVVFNVFIRVNDQKSTHDRLKGAAWS